MVCKSFSLKLALAFLCLIGSGLTATAQIVRLAGVGTWSPLTHQAPENIGYALLLSDGTVMAQGYSNTTWYRLTPDAKGSYANGTWSTLAPMHDTRLYFFAQLVKDGRVVLGGGEYGTGGTKSEYYQPLTNTWTPLTGPGIDWDDGVSTVIANGSVLTAPVYGAPGTLIYDLNSTGWVPGPNMFSGQDEASWVILPDSSILTIDAFTTTTERYIPSLNQWIKDTPCPVELYGWGGELGGAYLLPNGKAIFFGASSLTAIYTPSGTTAPGTWEVGAPIPDELGQIDAPAAVMPNGKILLALGTNAGFGSVSYWYEYDYITNTFTQVGSPTGGQNFNAPEFIETLLVLPDGTILQTGISTQLYVYTPAGNQLASAKPVIQSVTQNRDGSYHITGTQFNGINQGAGYGDDWQMSTNFPIARLTDQKGHVYYCRTYNWSNCGVMTGNLQVSTDMTPPPGLPKGQYELSIVANGIASNPVGFFDGFSATNVFLALGVNGQGDVSDLLKVDGECYSGTSVTFANSQDVNVEVDFALPSGIVLPSISVTGSAAAVPGATGMVFMYNWSTNQFVYLNSATPLSSNQTTFSASTSGLASQYIGPGGKVRVILKAVVPYHVGITPFTIQLDQLILG